MKQYVKSYFFSTITAGVALMAVTSEASAQYCREYTQNIMVGGRMQEGYSTACMQPDGSWQQVSSINRYPDVYTTDYVQPTTYNTTYVTAPPVIERRVVVRPAPIVPLFSLNFGHSKHHHNSWDYGWDDRHHGKHKHGRGHGDGYPSHASWRDDDRHGHHQRDWGDRRVYVDRRAD
jgi:hypothetical protein